VTRIAYDSVAAVSLLAAFACYALGAFASGLLAALFTTVVLAVREVQVPHPHPLLRPARRGKRGTGPGG
jgi:hypothetical protein